MAVGGLYRLVVVHLRISLHCKTCSIHLVVLIQFVGGLMPIVTTVTRGKCIFGVSFRCSPFESESQPITGPRHEPHSLLSEGDQGGMAPEEQDANPMYSRGQDEAAGGRLNQPGVSASLVFDSDGAPLDGEAMPITGSRHEPGILYYRKAIKVALTQFFRMPTQYSSGQDGAAGGRLNESEVFEAGLSASLVFDSDGHPVDGSQCQ